MNPPDVVFLPSPEDVARSQMTAFARQAAVRAGTPVLAASYSALHQYSTRQFRDFWRLFVEWSSVLVEGALDPVCRGDAIETAEFLPNARLSYAENLLRNRGAHDREIALTARDETGAVRHFSMAELRSRVLRLASALRAAGVVEGDHLVAIARNGAEAVTACLATASIGATWSSVSPDLGADAIANRFAQLNPVGLFTSTGTSVHGVAKRLDEMAAMLLDSLPTVGFVMTLEDGSMPSVESRRRTTSLEAAIATHPPLIHDGEAWPRFQFNHPLFVLFSSGTTGLPKCIVHGAGGTLIEHLKEHRLHTDLGPRDTMYFHTSCGWMMWNWQLSALASGARIVVYEGSVSFPKQDSLLQLLADERVTVFGTSPSYLQFCRDAGLMPAQSADLSALRVIQSTGSVLYDWMYDWAIKAVAPVPLQSISGGTDIIGCFVQGNPNLPVRRGESQCVGLGLDVRVMTAGGLMREGNGELVCCSPFPSRPVRFVGDPDGSRFHDAYFSQHDGLWTHGDYVSLHSEGARILGRSDGTLNVRGIRIGPAEIYQIVLGFGEVAQAMALEQESPGDVGGTRLVLLLVLSADVVLDRSLTLRIKKALSVQASSNHVPSVIAQVAELPMTFSGKQSERAARDAINGRQAANRSALRNPKSLDALAGHPALQVAPATDPRS